MGKVYSELNHDMTDFIRGQPIFFVASAPLNPAGHVNLSPKGMDTLRVLSATQVAYLDLNGSGNETSAHLTENGRITFMFCGFQARSMILRLYGQGRTMLPSDPVWPELAEQFSNVVSARQIIVADIHRVQTSCGFGVPQMELVGERDTLVRWAEAEGPDEMRAYQKAHNSSSIDGVRTPLAGAPV